MNVKGPNWSEIDIIRDFMSILDNCTNEEDPIKHDGVSITVVTIISQLLLSIITYNLHENVVQHFPHLTDGSAKI